VILVVVSTKQMQCCGDSHTTWLKHIIKDSAIQVYPKLITNVVIAIIVNPFNVIHQNVIM